ncbi:hypothetical protein [Vibrio parahaemolyticus]|uniref:hypothetical protein n=1 Tax=Vibrio parahaemolyticus TaxID=670 RepID=UPI00084B6E27|nr:hypothetical protein [Vibrio parahaemolyticus]ODZ63229.1 hypothetical protein BBM44_10535 [Vibrio parahaemolyticus]
MTFKAMLKCDACGCANEVELECFDPADAEDAVFDKSDETGWFADVPNCNHYCPAHAIQAKQELEEENQLPTGIYSTMVG